MARHPDWCAEGHKCGLGEHRSEPLTFPAWYGGLTFIRVANTNGNWIELRGSIQLDGGRDEAMQLATAVNLAVEAVKFGDTEALAPMIERMARVRR